MKKQLAVKSILGVSLVGMVFSGTLTVTKLFANTCLMGSEACAYIGPLPTCVYGFAMFATIFVLSILGLRGD